MEHPYLFFVKIFEAIGLGHFAHTYTHVVYSWVLMAILIITALAIVLLVLFFRRTRLGLAMRAVASNPTAASVVGIQVGRVRAASFALAGGLAPPAEGHPETREGQDPDQALHGADIPGHQASRGLEQGGLVLPGHICSKASPWIPVAYPGSTGGTEPVVAASQFVPGLVGQLVSILIGHDPYGPGFRPVRHRISENSEIHPEGIIRVVFHRL